MFKTFAGSWTFKETGNLETEVIFLYSFKLRFPFNFAIDFIKRNLQMNVRKRLIDLKAKIEEQITNS
jgi:hypothetical protein